MTAGSPAGDSETPRAQATGHDPLDAGAVEGYEPRGAHTGASSREEVLHSSQVAGSFLADGSYEENGSLRQNSAGSEAPSDREQCGEPSRVVADARTSEEVVTPLNGHIRPGGEDRVEMSADDERVCIAVASTMRPRPDDVSDRVGVDGSDSSLGHQLRHAGSPYLFREGRGRDLRELDLAGQRRIVVLAHVRDGLGDAGIFFQTGEIVLHRPRRAVFGARCHFY